MKKCTTRGCKSQPKPSSVLDGWYYCATCKTMIEGEGDGKLQVVPDLEPEPDVPPGKAVLIAEHETPTMCEEHPKYRALRKPRTGCDGCWEAYAQAWPERVNG